MSWVLREIVSFSWDSFFSISKNWRPPRLRAFGSGGRKRNTYEYACLLTRPDCCRNRKKVCQNLNEWIVIAIILIMYSSSTLIRSLVFLKLKKKTIPRIAHYLTKNPWHWATSSSESLKVSKVQESLLIGSEKNLQRAQNSVALTNKLRSFSLDFEFRYR